MFNDTPAQSLHQLLGVRQKVFMHIFKNNILKIYKVTKHNVKSYTKYIYQLYKIMTALKCVECVIK